MTDSEKLDLLLKKLMGIDEKVTGIDQRVTGLEEKVTNIDQRLIKLEEDVSDLKADMTDVKSQLVILHHDDKLILDEVERVHSILIAHKSDKSVHTA